MSREFGIYPENRNPKLWWGARAIASKKYGLDIPWDRQNFEGNEDSSDKDDFFHWLNNTAIPELDKRVKSGKLTNISFDSEGGCFHCEADDRNSYGYLYIGAWTTEVIDKRNDKEA